MHADDVEAATSLEEWRKAPEHKNISKAGDDRSPAWTWQTYLYHDGEHVSMPSANVMVCLRTAATQMILKRQKTYKEISQSGMMCDSEYLGFEVDDKGTQVSVADVASLRDESFADQAETVKGLGFRLFVKRARVGTSKHIRVRPRFDNWCVSGRMLVIAPELQKIEILRQMFNIAGRVGLCDWRPGCKTPGPFGMFESSVDVVK
jgi:hypothetical protein